MTTPSEPLYRKDTFILPDVPYCVIPLTQGQITFVSPHRFKELNQFKWYAYWNPSTQTYYASRNIHQIKGKQTQSKIYMHNQIYPLQDRRVNQVDHIDPSKTLDNTDENLRIATKEDQMHNQRKRKSNTSGFKGVSKDKKKWRACICIKGKDKHLGNFPTKELAHAAYCAAAKESFGEFARFE